jgi:hypothetical protein
MYSLFPNALIVNGELVHSRDIHQDLQSDTPHPRRDEDDATTLTDDSNSDVGEISDSENEIEADKYVISRKVGSWICHSQPLPSDCRSSLVAQLFHSNSIICLRKQL